MNALRSAIGVDIGGTKVAVGLVDGRGSITARAAFPTEPTAGFARAVKRLIEAIEQLLRECGMTPAQLAGIGIGCAGPVNPGAGTIHNPFTLPTWEGCNMVAPLREAFARPVALENDADAAVVGEAFAGAARAFRQIVMLTFGTGVGSGIFLDGAIYRGCDGEHPEAGHIPVDPEGPECYCGIRGCLEVLASGTAIAAAGRPAGFANAQAVFAAAAQGHPLANRIIERAARAVAVAGWTLAHTFMPDGIVLGGGLMAEQFNWFAAFLRQRLASASLVPRNGIQVVPATLGNDAGIIGAARLVLS
jgi:glucokinase